MDIYDILVLRATGIPIFAGCTATDYCRMHMDQHELQSAFLAALYTFSKETFKDTDLKQIVYDNIKLSFQIDEKNNLIMVFIHPLHVEDKMVREQLSHSMNHFVKTYLPKIKEYEVDDQLFELFKTDLRKFGIIEDTLMSTMMMQMEKEEFTKKKPGIVGWLKSKLRIS